jgi:hypothetical protein
MSWAQPILPPETPWYELPAVSAGGWLAVVLIFLWLFATDRIMTTKRHEKIVEDKDKQIELWHTSTETNRTTLDLATRNMDKLLEGVNTSNALIRSLPGVSERRVP